MKIDKDTWHYRLYRWWLESKFIHRFGSYHLLWDNTTQDDVDYELKDASDKLVLRYLSMPTPNLCQYINAVLIYAPLRKLFNSNYFYLTMLNIIIFVVLYMEQVNSEFNENMFVFGIVVMTIAIAFGIFSLIWYLGDKAIHGIKDIYHAWRNQPQPERKPTFYKSVVKPYVKARKAKICPFLTFE